MLCGIRGTSGVGGVDDSGHYMLMVTDGDVLVTIDQEMIISSLITVPNDKALNVAEGVTLTANGGITIQSGAVLNNYGTINNNGTIINNEGSELNNDGEVTGNKIKGHGRVTGVRKSMIEGEEGEEEQSEDILAWEIRADENLHGGSIEISVLEASPNAEFLQEELEDGEHLAGTKLALLPVAAEGYKYVDGSIVVVVDKDVDDEQEEREIIAPEYDEETGRFIFTMPENDVTVTAEFEEEDAGDESGKPGEDPEKAQTGTGPAGEPKAEGSANAQAGTSGQADNSGQEGAGGQAGDKSTDAANSAEATNTEESGEIGETKGEQGEGDGRTSTD